MSHLNARPACMSDKALVLWDREIMWEAPYWKNKLAVPSVNKSCWLRVLHGPLHCVQWKVSSSFPRCTWPEHKLYPVISVERCWNAQRNAPQHVCWRLWSGPSDVHKDILLGFTRFKEWLNLVFYFSTKYQYNLCPMVHKAALSHDTLFVLRPLRGCTWSHPSFFLPSAIYPLLPIMGTVRYFCPAHCGVYSVRNCHAISTIVSTKQENCCKTKPHQSTKGFEGRGWGADNPRLLPARARLVSCDLCCHGGARPVWSQADWGRGAARPLWQQLHTFTKNRSD